MQSASDLFLGWTEGREGRQFYIRQLKDMKVKLLVEVFTPSAMLQYAEICGWTLARAHARSGEPAAFSGYLGKSDAFDEAMVWTRNRQPEDAAKVTREQWDKIGTPIQPLPAEMKQLEPFIGEWDSDFINGPSVQSPKGSTSKGKMTARWILDGRFLLGTTEVGTHRSIWLLGCDTTKRAYRNVRFTNAGQIDESFGEWNDDTRSFVWKVVNERPGITRTSTTRFVGKDAIQAHILSEDKTGKVVQDLTIRSSRNK